MGIGLKGGSDKQSLIILVFKVWIGEPVDSEISSKAVLLLNADLPVLLPALVIGSLMLFPLFHFSFIQ